MEDRMSGSITEVTPRHGQAPSTDDETVAAKNFLRNMRSLWRHDPVMAMRVDAVHDHERLPLERTASGAWTAKTPLSDGRGTYLHSRHDPVVEAKRLIAAVPTEDKYCYVVGGMGLGYHVQALYQSRCATAGDAFIVVTEPSPVVIATAFCCLDFSDMIATGRLIIITDGDKSRLHQRLKEYGTLMMLGTHFLRHPPSRPTRSISRPGARRQGAIAPPGDGG